MPDLPNCTRRACKAVSLAIEELRQVDAKLTQVRENLPQGAVSTAELRGIVQVVQTDLLADAIDTLALVAGNGAVRG